MDVPFNYAPRDYQVPLWEFMLGGGKRGALVWHRRAGKDKTVWNWTIFAAVLQRPGTYFYFAPTYAQGKKIIWDGMSDDGFPFRAHVPPELILDKNETEMQLTVRHLGPQGGHSIIQIIGTDKLDSVRGTNPVGCIFTEFAFHDPRAWDIVEPILLANGGWALFISTPNGKNHFHKLYDFAKSEPGWFTSLLTIRDTQNEDGSPIISEEKIDRLRARGVSEETIQREYYCSFEGSVEGAYYARLMDAADREGRIRDVPWEPQLPVQTWWDLGIGDAMAVWFVQLLGREVRCIDYLEGQGEGFPYYAKELKDRPYVYDAHVMPHDASVRELGTGRSRQETATALGIRPIRIAKKLALDDGINAVRLVLPRTYFDKRKCDRGIAALRQYHKKKDEERQVYSDKPEHDWSSHGSDAFRTGAVGFREVPRQQPVTQAVTDFDPFSYGRASRGTATTDFDVFER